MSTGQLDSVSRHVRKVAGMLFAQNLSDAELLERFVAGGEEAAFAAGIAAGVVTCP